MAQALESNAQGTSKHDNGGRVAETCPGQIRV